MDIISQAQEWEKEKWRLERILLSAAIKYSATKEASKLRRHLANMPDELQEKAQ